MAIQWPSFGLSVLQISIHDSYIPLVQELINETSWSHRRQWMCALRIFQRYILSAIWRITLISFCYLYYIGKLTFLLEEDSKYANIYKFVQKHIKKPKNTMKSLQFIITNCVLIRIFSFVIFLSRLIAKTEL